jgi:hypothetical protein
MRTASAVPIARAPYLRQSVTRRLAGLSVTNRGSGAVSRSRCAGEDQRVSRRALGSRRVRGSNEALNALALTLSAELANYMAGRP